MTNKVAHIADKILNQIQQSKNILLHFHVNPDGDSVGGALAMMQVLKTLGKNVTVIQGDSSIPEYLETLPGISEVVKKNFFEIEIQKFDTFIIQDSSNLDRVSTKEQIIFPPHICTIVIDHHVTNTHFGQLNLVDETYPSVCQLLYDLFKAWNIRITNDMALCLLVGMYTDTLFKYPGVTSASFQAAADLAKLAPDFTQTIFSIENNQHPKSLELMGLYLLNTKHVFSNRVVCSSVSYADFISHQIPTDINVHGIANLLASAKGNDIAVILTEEQPNQISVSMRTRDSKKYDVAKIAVATGCGGGHPAAAGANFSLSLKEAEEKMFQTIASVYPDLVHP